LIAGVLGLIVGVMWVFGAQWWQSTKQPIGPEGQPSEKAVNK
jgi:hypothetical protein